MTFLSYGSYLSIRSNIIIFLTIACALAPLHTTLTPSHSNDRNKTENIRGLDVLHQSEINNTIAAPTKDSLPYSLTASSNVSSTQTTSSPNGSPLDDELLTDPLHPASDIPTIPNEPIEQPTLVTSALLTATTPAPSVNNSSSHDNGNTGDITNHSAPQTPVLSGSMTIHLPTSTSTAILPHPTQPYSTNNPAISSYQNTTMPPGTNLTMPSTTNTSTNSNPTSTPSVTTIVSGGSDPSTPTTSTALVYATHAPTSNSPALSKSSFAYKMTPSFFHIFISFGLIALLC